MLYIDVGNTLRGGLRTGIQRVVRSLSRELAVNAPDTTRLIAFDVAAGRYFALADPELIQSAGSFDRHRPRGARLFRLRSICRRRHLLRA